MKLSTILSLTLLVSLVITRVDVELFNIECDAKIYHKMYSLKDAPGVKEGISGGKKFENKVAPNIFEFPDALYQKHLKNFQKGQDYRTGFGDAKSTAVQVGKSVAHIMERLFYPENGKDLTILSLYSTCTAIAHRFYSISKQCSKKAPRKYRTICVEWRDVKNYRDFTSEELVSIKLKLSKLARAEAGKWRVSFTKGSLDLIEE